MNPCTNTQDLLLDHLYGTLDEAEETAVRGHLAGCAACREALERSRALSAVLAEAARVPGDGLTLAPPVRPWWRRPVLAAAAAALVLGAAALGLRAHALHRLASETPRLVVLAPAAVLPGEPAALLAEVTTPDGAPLRATVRAEIAGRSGTLATAATDAAGKARLAWTHDGPPGEQLLVNVAARLESGVESRASTILVRDGRRLLARVSTDKPLYRPGETLRVRALALERLRLTPGGDLPMRLQVLDPRGAPAAEEVVPAMAGLGAWTWAIPDGAAGGEYRVVLSDPGTPAAESFPKVERRFTVRSYRVPRIKGELTFDRDSYGPGAEGRATLTVERAEGGVPAGAALDAVVTVDGKPVSRETLALPPTGLANVRFTLPAAIERGEGQLAVVVRDGGTVETIAKTLPIALARLDVAFFPEGGELVAGLATRVYFRVRDSRNEPADLEADIVDAAGRVVAGARVEDQGMGRFELVPEAGQAYRLVARRPSGIALRGDFPRVVPEGVSVRSADDVVPAGRPVRVVVASTAAGRHAVTAWCRGAPVAQDTVELEPGVAREVALTPDVPVGGVFRITVLDPRGLPRAERLVSVTPPHRLDLEVRPSADGVSPGERVKVEVTARDEQGRPARAVLGVSVVDDTVLSLAKDEDTPDLPLHFLLGLEVEELERVELYSRGPGAARAVDRLLGIQGWRRFAWRDPRAFLAAQPGSGPRVLLASGSDRPQRVDNLERAQATLAAARRELDDRLLAAAAVAGLALAVAGALAAAVLGLRRRRPALWVPGLAVSGAVLLIPFLLPFALNDARERVRLGDVVDASLVAPPAPPAPGAQTPEVLRYVLDFSVGAPAPLPDPDFHRLHFFARGEAQGQAIDELEAVEEARAEWKQRPELERALRQVDGRFEDRKNLRFLALAREYAHKAQRAPDGARRDFTEVLYWNPNLVTGADGRAAFELETCDSVTTFSVAVEANDARGALAAAAGSFRNRVPFFLEPKLPQALSAGDRLLLPVVIANDTGAAADVSVELASGADVLRLATAGRQSVPVAAGARARVLYELRAAQGSGVAALTLSGRGPGAFEDRSVRSVPVTPRGFPIELARGGVLEKQDETAFRLPESFDRTTLDGSLRLYPSVVATLVDGLDALLREPSGCFEQASSTNYPNVLVLACLSERGTADQQVARRARDLLRLGYAKLAGYECSKRGYEWFGADPGHEALSAYGLLEFTDMARVHAVDPAMIARTRDWLLARRDGRGGFQRNARALDSFGGASPEVTDAYIVWALTEADPAIDIAVELAALEESARKTDDPYLLALGARALANRRLPAAKTLLDRLAGLQREDGGFAARGPSITSSTGPNLEVETAGLATLAFLTDPARLPNAERAVRFLAARRERGGSFGATQATILALKALVEHGRLARRAATDHAFTITVNGRALPVRHVAAGAVGAVVFDDGLRDALVPGENRIGLATTGAEPISWALALRTHATLPADDAGAPLRITATLDRAAAREGETVRLEVSLVNPGDEGVPMPLVRLGLPAGLEPRPDQLEELRKQGAVDFYETRPREVTCYFRGLAAKSEKRLALDLVAAIPGEFEGPATSAYPYYRDDRKAWAAPLRVRVEPAVR